MCMLACAQSLPVGRAVEQVRERDPQSDVFVLVDVRQDVEGHVEHNQQDRHDEKLHKQFDFPSLSCSLAGGSVETG